MKKRRGSTSKQRGWHTAATNFRTRFGEIDIIAENAQYLIFAEVKTRKNARYGPACEAVTPAKQAKHHRRCTGVAAGAPDRKAAAV